MTKSKVGTSTIFARDRRCSEKGGTHKASEWVGREILAGSRFPGIPGGSPFHTPDATTSQRFQPTKDSALPFKRYKRRFATIPSPSALLASFQNETQIVVELENIVRDFRIPGWCPIVKSKMVELLDIYRSVEIFFLLKARTKIVEIVFYNFRDKTCFEEKLILFLTKSGTLYQKF